jgi:hypothetical protein
MKTTYVGGLKKIEGKTIYKLGPARIIKVEPKIVKRHGTAMLVKK